MWRRVCRGVRVGPTRGPVAVAGMAPDLTFVVPFRNEEKYLRATLETLTAQDMGCYVAEVLLVDGSSEDGSRQIADEFAASHSTDGLRFRVVDNPERRIPFAFNLGVRLALAPVVGFGGAHSIYPNRFFRTALDVLAKVDSEVVGGGHDRIVPGDTGAVARAMACLYRSPMGSAVAAYHRRTTPGLVDTVYGGFYRREVFDRVGLFDEKLARNQDNELNSRVTAAGLRIHFEPALSISYVQKTDLRTFLRRGVDFGLHHPETWRANWRAFRLRHAVPAMFVAYLLLIAVPALLGLLPLMAAGPLLLYGVLLLGSGLWLAMREGLVVGLLTIPLFCGYHVAYGLGTVVGILTLAARLTTGRA